MKILKIFLISTLFYSPVSFSQTPINQPSADEQFSRLDYDLSVLQSNIEAYVRMDERATAGSLSQENDSADRLRDAQQRNNTEKNLLGAGIVASIVPILLYTVSNLSMPGDDERIAKLKKDFEGDIQRRHQIISEINRLSDIGDEASLQRIHDLEVEMRNLNSRVVSYAATYQALFEDQTVERPKWRRRSIVTGMALAAWLAYYANKVVFSSAEVARLSTEVSLARRNIARHRDMVDDVVRQRETLETLRGNVQAYEGLAGDDDSVEAGR